MRSRLIRHIVILIGVVCLVGSFVSGFTERAGAYPNGHIISVPIKKQEKDQWCWAASIQSVTHYYGQSPDQCSIVKQAYGTCPNWSAHIHQVHLVLARYNLLSTYMERAASWYEIKDSINNGHPSIARWAWDGGGGHMVAIKGWHAYSDTDIRLRYVDPWPGDEYVQHYNSFRYGPGHTWTHTNLDIHTP